MAQLQGSNSSWDYTNDKLQNYTMKHVSNCGQKKVQPVLLKSILRPNKCNLRLKMILPMTLA